MTLRRKRRRGYSGGITSCKLHELLAGKRDIVISRHYDGYADGQSQAELELTKEMRTDWENFRDEILEFWISGRWTTGREFRLTPKSAPIRVLPNCLIRGLAGTRPWIWWELDSPELLDHEREDEYLSRHGLLLPTEERLMAAQANEQIKELRAHRDLVKAGVWSYTDAERRQELKRLNREIRWLRQRDSRLDVP